MVNIVPGFTVKIWATVKVSTAERESIAELEVDSMKGGRDFSKDDSYGFGMSRHA